MNNLTSEQAKKLRWQCEEEGFIEMIDAFIPALKTAIKRGNARPKPSDVQEQLNKVKKALNALSDEAKEHIAYYMTTGDADTLEEQMDASMNSLDSIAYALDMEYAAPTKVSTQKAALMKFLRKLNASYGLRPSEGEEVAQVICASAGMKCGSTIFKQARNYDDFPECMRPLKKNLSSKSARNG
jgi:septation ring formation regulator EzrA